MEHVRIRDAEPSDYESIISVVNAWWDGRNMRDMLPKLFFVHFRQTSFVAEANGQIAGFLTGFVSQTVREEAYIHFAGVGPEFRRKSIGRALYQHLFSVARPLGCRAVRCVTSPVNRNSIAFHLRLGFTVEPTETSVEGLCIARDYDGPGEDRVLFVKRLDG